MNATITNVKVDVFDWETPNWRVGSGMRFGGRNQLSVVSIETDAGVTGNAFCRVPSITRSR